MMLPPTCSAMHRCVAGFARGSSESIICDQDLITATERLAAMMADAIDLDLPITIGALPGHVCLPYCPESRRPSVSSVSSRSRFHSSLMRVSMSLSVKEPLTTIRTFVVPLSGRMPSP